jgi:hypothetical protein
MFKLYVIPTREDQMAFESGNKPHIVFNHEFATQAERDEYGNGLEAVYDLLEHTIVHETATTLAVLFGDDDEDGGERYTFSTEAEKNAYKAGLSDGDGFVSPQVIERKKDPDEFARLEALLAA